MLIYLCAHVYIHICTTSLANPSQPEKTTSEGSYSNKGLCTRMYLKCTYICIWRYTRIYRERHHSQRERPRRGHPQARGYINVHIWNAYMFMCICRHTHIYNGPISKGSSREIPISLQVVLSSRIFDSTYKHTHTHMHTQTHTHTHTHKW